MKQTSSSGYVFFGDFRGAKVEKKMDHLSCFSGGMFALGSKYMDNPEHHLELGAKVTETCHKSYDNSGKCIYGVLRPDKVIGWFQTFLLWLES